MKKLKNNLTLILIFILIIFAIVFYYQSKEWPNKFKSELDHFFGADNWKCISEETKESIIYTDYIRIRSNPELSGEIPGKYKNWYIQFNNKYGEEEIWSITNHVFKINNDKYDLFHPKRFSSKQAFIQELMNISFEIASEEVFNEIILSELSQKEADCIDVSISYHGGNPKPEFYDALFKESWFTANKVNAENFLACDLYDFYLYIRAFDYKVEKLTDEEQQNLFNSFENIQKKLLQKYGKNASFEIYFDKEHKVEYIDGNKQF